MKEEYKIENNIYVRRLFKEWKEHSKVIISIDFDDTLKPWKSLGNERDIKRVINLIKLIQNHTYNVIFTASDNDRHQEIRDYCKSIGIRVDSINKNPISLPYGNEGKIYYNINICDRSGIKEATEILESAWYNYRGYLEHKNLEGDPA